MTKRDFIKLSFLSFLGLFLPKCKKEDMGKGLYYGMVQQDNAEPVVIPTFILIGDSNIDGRGILGESSTSKYFSEYAADIINSEKITVKIFDNRGGSNTWVTLTKDNSQIQAGGYDFGYEQTLMWELAQFYGIQEIRIIKRGISSGLAGIYSNWPSYTPGQTEALAFESDLQNAIDAAILEGITLDFKAVITGLGTNDAAATLVVANAYEAAMTSIINHFRNDIFDFDIPFILTSCTKQAGVVLYPDTIIAAQQSISSALADVFYCPIYGFSVTSHTAIAGIFGVGLHIADSLITNVLGGSSIAEKYIFKFDTNRNGSFLLKFAVAEDFYDYYIDWGDGNQTLVTTDFMDLNHTYTDGTTKTIKIIMPCPWNIFQLHINAASTSNIVGTFNMEDLTGLDTFTSSSNNTGMTSITYPRANYSYLTDMAPNLLINTGLTSLDLTRFNCDGININSNTSLLTIVDNSSSKAVSSAGNQFQSNSELTSLNIGCWVFTGPMYVRLNAKLTTFVHPSSTPTAMTSWRWCGGNSILQTFSNYAQSIYASNYEFDNADLTTTMVNNIINEMWDRCQDTSFYRTSANKSVKLNGNNGYSGVFDGTTDWSGGLPTSPGAKAYDLLNDVTGTYNFSTFTL